MFVFEKVLIIFTKLSKITKMAIKSILYIYLNSEG